jgi:hypothetical protein
MVRTSPTADEMTAATLMPDTTVPAAVSHVESVSIPWGKRVIVATGIAILVTAVTFTHLHLMLGGPLGYDFNLPWRAAHIVLAGADPYHVIRGVADFPFVGPYRYPMPATIVAMPFVRLSGDAAAALFSGISTGLLAFGLTARSWDRLIILLSPACLTSIEAGQWSSIMMAGALLPWLSWVGICKPTAGLAVLLGQRSWRGLGFAIGGGLLLLAISFAVRPTWLADYLWLMRHDDAGGANWYLPPAAVWFAGGPLLLLAASRWRRHEARYLLGAAVAPAVLTHYTAFFAMLVAETRAEAMILALGSVVAWIGVAHSGMEPGPILQGRWIVPCVFLPALVIVLRRPNVTPV